MVFLRALFAIAALLLLAACGADTEEIDTWEFYEESQDQDTQDWSSPFARACIPNSLDEEENSIDEDGYTINLIGVMDDGNCLQIFMDSRGSRSPQHPIASDLAIYPDDYRIALPNVANANCLETPSNRYGVNALAGEIEIDGELPTSLSVAVTVDYGDTPEGNDVVFEAHNLDIAHGCDDLFAP